MADDSRYKLFGVYVSEPVTDALEEYLYDTAGVVDLEGYFDTTSDLVPVGDPGADATDELVADVLEEFAALYDRADFDAAERVAPDAFDLVHLAARPQQVSDIRERFRAASTIQETDSRTVQTAILAAYFETDVDD
ncbi:hypothetical protein [Natronorubrum halophilum]|uniref:hypothetical protein n=1 Tax=Natronorubrum halophilum TaxID=1702106 RepID=UPI000EF64A15|nr:hypothetical protein [Natronorubrum halophilum]